MVKHALKHAAGLAGSVTLRLMKPTEAHGCVLMYHRVVETGLIDYSADNWNVRPARLEEQLRWLSNHAQCVTLAELLNSTNSVGRAKPSVALTFDDGFACFRQEVLPLLCRYQIPATLFVVTGFMDSRLPFPFDHWGQKNHSRIPTIAWRPISWKETQECLDSGFVSVGSHSHQHLNALEATDQQLEEEAMVSRELLIRHLGQEHATLYAYPYGCSRLGQVRTAYIDAVRRAGYACAVTTDLGLAVSTTPPFQIPRVEVHAYDSPQILNSKILGNLWAQDLCQRLRQAKRN
jgi:peptidoglycan/xylan/chitin deacetylase (PgdA/CDA1 family)